MYHKTNGKMEDLIFPDNSSVNLNGNIGINGGSGGFMTASGKKVHVSEAALKHAKALLQDVITCLDTEVGSSTSSEVSKFGINHYESGREDLCIEPSVKRRKIHGTEQIEIVNSHSPSNLVEGDLEEELLDSTFALLADEEENESNLNGIFGESKEISLRRITKNGGLIPLIHVYIIRVYPIIQVDEPSFGTGNLLSVRILDVRDACSVLDSSITVILNVLNPASVFIKNLVEGKCVQIKYTIPSKHEDDLLHINATEDSEILPLSASNQLAEKMLKYNRTFTSIESLTNINLIPDIILNELDTVGIVINSSNQFQQSKENNNNTLETIREDDTTVVFIADHRQNILRLKFHVQKSKNDVSRRIPKVGTYLAIENLKWRGPLTMINGDCENRCGWIPTGYVSATTAIFTKSTLPKEHHLTSALILLHEKVKDIKRFVSSTEKKLKNLLISEINPCADKWTEDKENAASTRHLLTCSPPLLL